MKLKFNGQEKDVSEWPTAVLVAVFLRWQGLGADMSVAIVRELRSRPNERWSPFMIHRFNRVDPPPCACGRKGIYIVGAVTFCSACKHKAVESRTRYAKTVIEPRCKAKSRDINDRDRRLRNRDLIRKIHRRVEGKRM